MRTTVGSLASWLMAYTMMQVGCMHGSLAPLAASLAPLAASHTQGPTCFAVLMFSRCWVSAVQSASAAVGLRILRSALLQWLNRS